MSYHENENMKKNIKMNKNIMNDELSSIIDLIIENETYQEGKNKIQELFKSYISNEKLINFCLTIINNIIILKGNFKHKILSTIPEISYINPKSFFPHVDIILSIFQSCLTDDNSPYYSQISQYFGDTVKVLLNELNSENYNTYIINDNHQNLKNNLNNQKNLFLVYTKFKLFCLSNIKSNNIGCQICGTLCLTSFIENCSFNYINNENLKCIFDNLCMQINNPNFPGKLEILNCFISLVFCSEEKYIPYSIMTLNIIIVFIKDQEWLIRKFSLNIIYTMLYYCKKEILEKRDFILENLKLLKNEENIEVKEIAEQIIKMINEEESTNMIHNDKINFLSDNLYDSNNSKFSSGEQSKKYYINNYSMSNKDFKICEEEKKGDEINKSRNIAHTTPGISKRNFQNSFLKNHKNKNEKSQIKAKSNKKRKVFNKNNDTLIDNYIQDSASKKDVKKYNKNLNKNAINGKKDKDRRKVFSNNLPNKTRNKNIPPSRNSFDKFYGIKKNNPISMILKKRNIIVDNNLNNIKTENRKIKLKTQEKGNFFGIRHFEKSKGVMNLNQNKKNINNKSSVKKTYPIKKKNSKTNIIIQNNVIIPQKLIKGRNDIIKQNNFISNTTININNNSFNNRDILKLNRIPSFGKGSEEDILMPFYSNENSEYIEELKLKKKYYENQKMKNKEKLIKLYKKNKHNYSFENKKTHSKNIFMNRSLENNILLNYSGNEIAENKENINQYKIQNTIGTNYINNYIKNKSKPKFNKSNKKNEYFLYNNNKRIKSKYRYNNSKKNNKIKRVSKIDQERMNIKLKTNKINLSNNKNENSLINKNNYEKDSKINQIDNKYKFSPGSKLQDSLDFHKLFHSFSNNENENKENENKIKNKNNIIDNKIFTHKVNHSFQVHNSKNIKPKIKNIKNKNIVKNKQNKKIQIQRKAINNNMISIQDDKPLIEIKNNDVNIELISQRDKSFEPIEIKFKEYKNETSKIINDLKLQVNFLKTTLGNFEEINKKKENLNNEIRNNNYIKAFQIAVELGKIQDIYYVIKKYQLSSIEENIPQIVLGEALKILCEDILSCENIRLVSVFIIRSVCNKNIKFENNLNKNIFNTFVDLYNKKKELCLMKIDINNILKIINYFSISK